MKVGSYFRLLAVAVLAYLLVACENDSDDAVSKDKGESSVTAATLGAQTVLRVQEYIAQARYGDADQENGAIQANMCRACHSFDKGGPHMIGPALFGFFGTQAGSRKGYDYSSVMQNASFVWTPRALDGWLAQPGRFLPGNRMTFAGVMRQSDRDDLVAYLLARTSITNSNDNRQD